MYDGDRQSRAVFDDVLVVERGLSFNDDISSARFRIELGLKLKVRRDSFPLISLLNFKLFVWDRVQQEPSAKLYFSTIRLLRWTEIDHHRLILFKDNALECSTR